MTKHKYVRNQCGLIHIMYLAHYFVALSHRTLFKRQVLKLQRENSLLHHGRLLGTTSNGNRSPRIHINGRFARYLSTAIARLCLLSPLVFSSHVLLSSAEIEEGIPGGWKPTDKVYRVEIVPMDSDASQEYPGD